VLVETPNVYAYLLGPPSNATATNATVPNVASTNTTTLATHVLVWRPVAAGAGPASAEPRTQAQLNLPRAPIAGWAISGAGAVAVANLSTVARRANSNVSSGSIYNITISAVPLLLKF
jgi:hypothetical protein